MTRYVSSDAWLFLPLSYLAYTASLETAMSERRDVIVEARFNRADQVWRFVRLRMDKPRANHLEVVQALMMNTAEPISRDMVGHCVHMTVPRCG